MKKTIAAAMVLSLMALTVGTTGCLGRGALGKSVMKFNLEVTQNRWLRWGVFLLLNPVYAFAGVGDLLVVNSIEFHTGTNPWNGETRLAKVGETLQQDRDGEQVVSTLMADGSVDLVVTESDGTETHLNVLVRDGEYVARDASGEVVARVQEPGSVPPEAR